MYPEIITQLRNSIQKSLSGAEAMCMGTGASMDVDDAAPTESNLAIHIPCATFSSCMQNISDIDADKDVFRWMAFWIGKCGRMRFARVPSGSSIPGTYRTWHRKHLLSVSMHRSWRASTHAHVMPVYDESTIRV